MSSRRRAVLIVALAGAILQGPLAGLVWAADAVAFSQDAFVAAQNAGNPILVHVRASWCPICKRQAPLLAKLMDAPRFRSVKRFDVDFDTQKDALRTLGARMQSTLIAFKGSKEIARSIGQTQPEWLEDFLEKLL